MFVGRLDKKCHGYLKKEKKKKRLMFAVRAAHVRFKTVTGFDGICQKNGGVDTADSVTVFFFFF